MARFDEGRRILIDAELLRKDVGEAALEGQVANELAILATKIDAVKLVLAGGPRVGSEKALAECKSKFKQRPGDTASHAPSSAGGMAGRARLGKFHPRGATRIWHPSAILAMSLTACTPS